jgi:hypothetical protein
MDLANYHGNFLVDSLAIFPAPKGESPLSSGTSGRPEMGTSDELGVLFSVFFDCGIRILLGKKRNPSKVVSIASTLKMCASAALNGHWSRYLSFR